MRAAVTGGAGFIGRHTVRALEALGYEVRVVDRARGVDVLSMPRLLDHLAGVDVVVHLAGVLGTAELFDRVDEAIDVNVKGTAHVLQACELYGAAFVGITMPDVWANVYQATKGAARRLATAYHRRGVHVAHVRAWNVYGEGQAHGPGHPQKLVPTFARAAWTGEPLPVWGDGQQTVDLVYVGEVARMLALVAHRTRELNGDRIYDAGTGRPVTVQAVAERILTITGSTSRILHLPMRAGEDLLDEPLAAPGAGWQELGWEPGAGLEDSAFTRTVESYETTFRDRVATIATPRRIGQAERQVVTRDDNGRPAGYHVVHWDGRQDGVAMPETVRVRGRAGRLEEA